MPPPILRVALVLGLVSLLFAGCGRAPTLSPSAQKLEGTYESIGQGMGATLTLANEKLAYTLSDRGTYLARHPGLELLILVEGDPLLFNPYGVIAVNPEKHPYVNFKLAMEFINYLTSYETQQMIGQYRKEGEVLFQPNSDEWRAGGSSYRLPETPPAQKQSLLLATTTSTADSGLLDYILPPFEQAYNAQVKVIAVGTGEAIATAQRGDADVVLVHARSQEEKFVSEGYGVNRKEVMYNDFVLLGPSTDPAGIKGMRDAAAAFRRIAQAPVTFISRGDNSGTHIKEMVIWQQAGIEPLPQERRYRWSSG